jgi:dihydropteroate synthase
MPAVSAEEELKRVIPVILALKRTHPAAVISVDTYKAATARAAVGAGAEIVNDVSGFRWDSQMLSTVTDLKCGAVLMHMRGRPEQWHSLPPLTDVVGLVKQELTELVENVIAQGVGRERIVLDPGFGFGKSFDQNYPLIAHLDALQEIGFPLLAGASRKSFIGRTLGGEKSISPAERLFGTIAAETALILNGAHILRTHSVRASAEAARVADATLKAT